MSDNHRKLGRSASAAKTIPLQKSPAAGGFMEIDSCTSGSPGTPKRWERTQSEVYLKGKATPQVTAVEAVTVDLKNDKMSGSDSSLDGKVSEHAKVYWDLPGAVEETASGMSSSASSSSSKRGGRGGNMKFTLQTIHQKEELTNDNFPSVGFGQYRPKANATGGTSKASSSSSSSSYESSAASSTYGSSSHGSHSGGTIYSVYEQQSGPGTIRITKRQSSYEVYPPDELDVPPSVTMPSDTGRQVFDKELNKLKAHIGKLTSESMNEQSDALDDILQSLQSAWTTPQYGRSLAYKLCDALRTEGGLGTIINNCTSTIYDILLGSARVLSQCLTSPNREFLVTADKGLKMVVKMSNEHKQDSDMLAATTGILEGLFKHSESTCRQLVELGSLDLMSYSCRSIDKCTLRNCAMGLANLALYGSKENHEDMMRAKIPDWLFPMAFSGDDVVRYYAFMAICALSVSRELAPLIEKSGTMALVEPFIAKHSPKLFARSASVHFQGKSDDWLKRLVPMLQSESRQAQSLAAFHFAMEASVKHDQKNLKILYDVGAVPPLKAVAASPNKLASRFACEALTILGEQIPYKLSSHPPPLWSKTDVQNWLKQIGFADLADVFYKLNIDGDILLSLTPQQLSQDAGITNGIQRQRFLRRLTELKLHADYTSCDASNVCSWLSKVDPQLLQYAYSMLNAGVSLQMIPDLTDDHLKYDCAVANGIHRLKILQAAEGRIDMQHSFARSMDAIDSRQTNGLDVFISYRRSTGSQLASLLKVHLQLRGFTVFLDIEKLAAGKFDDRLLSGVKQAKNFILVLSTGALERCLNDTMNKDWVHREIVAALNSECNIVPVMDDFTWPTPDSLPADMRNITRFNGIRWIHDYQDACVDKLENFLRTGSNEMQAADSKSSKSPPLQKFTSLPLENGVPAGAEQQ